MQNTIQQQLAFWRSLFNYTRLRATPLLVPLLRRVERGAPAPRWVLFFLLFFCATFLRGQTCQLVCRSPESTSPIEIAIDQTCRARIVPQVVLQDPEACTEDKTFIITYDGQVIAEGVNEVFFDAMDLLGQTVRITTRVGPQEASNFCNSFARIVDNLPPSLICSDTSVICIEDTSAANLGFPALEDNCAELVLLDYEDEVTATDCGPDTLLTVNRQWMAEDNSGNVTTCTQQIYVLRTPLASIDFPADTSLECSAPDADPSVTGRPMLADSAIRSGGLCDFIISFSDDTTLLCGDIERQIERTWRVVEQCTGNATTDLQRIIIQDDTPPQIACPTDLVVSTASGECFGQFVLPEAEVTDNCDQNPTYLVQTSFNRSGLGPHTYVPLGNHTATYTPIDRCGNLGTPCTINITVEDNEEPAAICDEFTAVALPSTGSAMVAAETFNSGSYDNCEPLLHYKARRMQPESCDGLNGDDSDASGYQEWFDDQVFFCCEDVGDTVQVIMRVYTTHPGFGAVDPEREMPGGDLFGQYNDCMVQVRVQDKIAPRLVCPPDKVVRCNDPSFQIDDMGSPSVIERCGFSLDSTTVESYEECGTGTITRTFTATDLFENTSTCTQEITLINDFELKEELIDWPENYTIEECGASLHPDSLPASFAKPIVQDTGCSVISINYEDQQFDAAYPACFKILRKWQVMDWCVYDPNDPDPEGIFEFNQILKVTDSEAPVLTCPGDIAVPVTNSCTEAYVDVPTIEAFDCSPKVRITNNSPYADSAGPDASGTYPIGVHEVVYTATDHCGNVERCNLTITVTDQKPPSAVCLTGLSVNLTHVNGNVQAVVTADMLDKGSSDPCDLGEEVILGLRQQVEEDPVSPPESDTVVFTCEDIGTQFVELWVTDRTGNSDYCLTYISVQDNQEACSPGEGGGDPSSGNDEGEEDPRSGMIAGDVLTTSGFEVEDVVVQIREDAPMMAYTGLDGYFEIPEVAFGKDYTVVPERNDNPLNGVSTMDIILISKHILGLDPLPTPYQQIAADIDRSGSISTLDLVRMRKLILGIDKTLPNNNTSWRFVSADYEFQNEKAPLRASFPEVRNINNFNKDEMNANFVAVKVGDVNNSARPNSAYHGESRAASGTVSVDVRNQEVFQGAQVEVTFSTQALREIIGYQFTLQFDPQALELTAFEVGDLEGMTEDNFNFGEIEHGVISTSWGTAMLDQLPPKADLFTLNFRVHRNGKLSDYLGINSILTAAEAYNDFGESMDVQLRFLNSNGQAEAEGFELFQNRPNPFTDQTIVPFRLPRADQVKLTIYDVSGKVIYSWSGEFASGYNEILVSASDLSVGGLLYYQLETSEYTAVKKMILTRD